MTDKLMVEKQIRLAMTFTQVVVPMSAVAFVAIYFIVGISLANY